MIVLVFLISIVNYVERREMTGKKKVDVFDEDVTSLKFYFLWCRSNRKIREVKILFQAMTSLILLTICFHFVSYCGPLELKTWPHLGQDHKLFSFMSSPA